MSLTIGSRFLSSWTTSDPTWGSSAATFEDGVYASGLIAQPEIPIPVAVFKKWRLVLIRRSHGGSREVKSARSDRCQIVTSPSCEVTKDCPGDGEILKNFAGNQLRKVRRCSTGPSLLAAQGGNGSPCLVCDMRAVENVPVNSVYCLRSGWPSRMRLGSVLVGQSQGSHS